MSVAIDITGQRFHYLVANKPISGSRYKKRVWECQCDCGNIIHVITAELRKGHTKSCGCWNKEKAVGHMKRVRISQLSHGHALKKHKTPTYYTWVAMRGRCKYPSMESYPRYGGRGITVCDRWDNTKDGFENFLTDMGLRPEGTSIDRIDVDGNYEPSNCRWATAKEQRANRRPRS